MIEESNQREREEKGKGRRGKFAGARGANISHLKSSVIGLVSGQRCQGGKFGHKRNLLFKFARLAALG